MIKLKKLLLMTRHEYKKELNETALRAEKSKKAEIKKRIESLEKDNERKRKHIEQLAEKIADMDAELEVYQEHQTSIRNMTEQRIELDGRESEIDAREEVLARREQRVEDQEEGEYKKGYADGVADGVRKINEITAVDRENAMKVAMVAAASHTSPEVVKELNANVKGLAEGTED